MGKIAIIGSGYGGAVAAEHLAKKGIQVDLIEMGADWDALPKKSNGRTFDRMLESTERSFWFESRTDMPFAKVFGMNLVNKPIKRAAGALGLKRFANMKVYVGRGVGGGSLVNGGMAVVPKKSFFAQVLPQLDAEEMYSVYFPRALAGLKASPPPADILANSPFYQFARVAACEASGAGYAIAKVPNVYDWNYLRQESFDRVPRSATVSEVIFGNNYGKNDLTKTYLRRALATGKVTVIPFTEVTQLQKKTDGTFSLHTKTIDFWGKITDQRVRDYEKVILAAGSVGTTELLTKAKEENTISGLPASVGGKWGPNGNVMVGRNVPSGTGANQSAIPALGIDNWDNSVNSVFAEIAPFPAGISFSIAPFLAITNNPNYGTFTWNKTSGKMELDWDDDSAAPSVAAAKRTFDSINAHSGGSYRTDIFANNRIFETRFTYHPLGGATIGEVTDTEGRVQGVSGLYVLDGALIPAKIGVNPFVAIVAVVERAMDKLMAQGEFA